MKNELNQGERVQPKEEKLDSRVIPVMREAVAGVQLVLYGILK